MRPEPHWLPQRCARRSRGFTLVELILVIVVGSVMAATLVVFFKPAIEAYLASRSRASLADAADTAMRRMVRDVRSAVPNSVRTPGDQCFEMVPSAGGGRYRLAADPVNASMPLDTSAATTTFDVLTPLVTLPAAGDWVVIGNQSPNDVYAGINRAAISAIATPAASAGRHRLSIAATQFPIGYEGGRFSLVAGSEASVFYVCSGADGTLDANGDGRGTLVRLKRSFTAAYPSSCPATTGADVMARGVKSCSFVYDPNQGATQQNGFVWMQLELARRGESAHLAMGAHVSNAP